LRLDLKQPREREVKYRFIDLANAPVPAKRSSEQRTIATEIVLALEPGKVAVVAPDRPEGMRSLKVYLTQAAKRKGRAVKTWDADGQVYVALKEPAHQA
jgi:hypothetical protein